MGLPTIGEQGPLCRFIMHSDLVLFYDRGLADGAVFRHDASDGPGGRVARVHFHSLIRIFQCNVIGDLTVDILFVEVGNPVVLITSFDSCQQPCGESIGENVACSGAFLVFFCAISCACRGKTNK